MTPTPHIDALRERKVRGEPLTRLEALILNVYYINRNNAYFDMIDLDQAAADLKALGAKESEKE